MAIEKNIRAAYDRGRVVNPGGYAGEKDYDWSSKDNPALQQKMNEAVDRAVNDYLQKIESGEISFPENLQNEMEKIGNKTRHDLLRSQSDVPNIFSETLQEGVDKSNVQQKQKRSREQELLDEMNQTRLSNEDWLKQADERQLTAESPLFLRDFNYDVTAPQTNKGIMQAAPYEDRIMEMADRQRREELMRLASMEQYPTETEDSQGNWLRNLLNPQRMGRTALSYLGKKAGPGIGLGMLTGPIGWAGAGLAGLGNRLRGGVSQNAFEQARQQRRLQSRKDYMMDRRAQGLEYGEENLADVFKQLGQQDIWQPPQPKAPPTPRVPDFITGGGGNGGVTPGSMGMSRDPTGGSPFNIGGLASLWRR